MKPVFRFLTFGLFLISGTTFAQSSIHFPLGGNAWIQGGKTTKVSEKGIANWSAPNEVIESYVRLAKAGKMKIILHAKTDGKTKLSISVSGKSKTILLIA